jgi:hypothetical protein
MKGSDPWWAGHGKNPTFRPHGGYYKKPLRIQLSAQGLSSCPDNPSQPAYTKLYARGLKKPGGRFGHWFLWAGSSTICTFDLGY